jgi:hypothetical protein
MTAYNIIKWMPCEKNNIFWGVAFTSFKNYNICSSRLQSNVGNSKTVIFEQRKNF